MMQSFTTREIESRRADLEGFDQHDFEGDEAERRATLRMRRETYTDFGSEVDDGA